MGKIINLPKPDQIHESEGFGLPFRWKKAADADRAIEFLLNEFNRPSRLPSSTGKVVVMYGPFHYGVVFADGSFRICDEVKKP